MPVSNFIAPLVLTIAVECAAAGILGCRDKMLFFSVAVVNLMTNPFMNFIAVLLYLHGMAPYFFHIMIPLEAAMVFAEWGMLAYAFPKKTRQLLLLSAVMNLASFLAGLWVF